MADDDERGADAECGATPLSPPARGLLGLLLAKYGTPDEEEPATYADAYELLHRYGEGLFGAPR